MLITMRAVRRFWILFIVGSCSALSPAEARVCLERYSGDEEPPYRVLLWACWNLAETGVHGSRARIVKIPKWAMMTKNFARRSGIRYSPEESTDAQA
jgi:hypothetical protein